MTIEIFNRTKEASLDKRLGVLLCRIVALALFTLGVFYWVRLVGVYDGPLWRFDTMPLSWRIVASSLAVLYPIAGVGLWMPSSWGVVVWVLVAAIEAGCVLALPAAFGTDLSIAAFHAGALVLLLALKAWPIVVRRIRRLKV
ncbi:DUF6163 family protein [Aureimonas populi]|uniref:DUF6163 family protein n=1 Tax=Aureimonas populi TaxID=1701758 RepID=A0ABW5CFK2_9HYPH|nr:DUF6163 family protein [Aureimonas populi]